MSRERLPWSDVSGRDVRAGSWLPVGAWLRDDVHGVGCSVVTVDADGVLWWLVSVGERPEAARWCVRHHVRWFGRLADLVDAAQLGQVVGLVPELAPWVGVPCV